MIMGEGSPKAIILMGVSGCGKTAVGKALSQALGWPFFDGDDFHPAENIAKMSEGIPLNDDDRTPWLEKQHDLIDSHLKAGSSIILACSALKKKYRDRLKEGNLGVVFVYLKGDFNLIYSRMSARDSHYMKTEMLSSQFDALEEPRHAITVDIDNDFKTIVEEILQRLP
jgi:gluconokinase